IKLLLEHGADVNCPQNPNFYMASPLMLYMRSPQASEDILQDMLQRGANVNAQDPNNDTALMYAIDSQPASLNSQHLIELLFSHHANPNLKDLAGRTALSIAYRRGFSSSPRGRQIIQMLKQAGAKE